jgi:hypothetical protein
VKQFWSGWQYMAQQTSVAAILYCHRVKTADGKERLLIVSLKPFPGDNGFGAIYTIETAFYDPGTLFREPNASLTSTSIDPVARSIGLDQRYRPPLRIFAGQADPADPSHFTMVMEVAGRRYTVDGRPDGPISLKLSVREVR